MDDAISTDCAFFSAFSNGRVSSNVFCIFITFLCVKKRKTNVGDTKLFLSDSEWAGLLKSAFWFITFSFPSSLPSLHRGLSHDDYLIIFCSHFGYNILTDFSFCNISDELFRTLLVILPRVGPKYSNTSPDKKIF